jgi:excisionase family DNA binding protein
MKEFDRDWSHARRNHQDDDEWNNWSRETSAPTRAIATSTDALDQPLLVTVEEAARLLGIGRTTMFELIGNGEVKSIRLGRRRLIARRSLEHFVDEHSFNYR